MADNGWIVTYTGKKFWPLTPRIEDIDILDIAHALSNICRFTGHCRSFYSVAQHSLMCSFYAPSYLKLSMLLHDASEAYLCDLSRPVKHSEGMSSYRSAEARLQTLIGQRYGVEFVDPYMHVIDDKMLMTERRDLTNTLQTWSATHEPPYEAILIPMGPAEAELAFLSEAERLLPSAQERSRIRTAVALRTALHQ